MIEMAGRLPAHQLRRVDPHARHLADRADEAALARQEARAHQRRGLTLSLPVDGLVRLSGVLGTEDAATLHAALHPLCRPIAGDDRPAPQRRADALVEICRLALRTEELPADGGEPPQLAVTVAYQPLTHTLGTAGTDTGQRLSAATARRLARDARILPVVLGSAGQILDTGRAHPPGHRSTTPRPAHPRPRLRLPRLRPATTLDRRPPHHRLDRRRSHYPRQPRPALPPPPPPHPPPPSRLADPPRPRPAP